MSAFYNRDQATDLPLVTYLEHAEDVLGCWLAWRAKGDVGLVVVTNTDGGGVRAPGALMAVSATGDKAGYISGGCIDADVMLNAQEALRTGKTVSLKYGKGSPFIDLPLPCGGMIELMIVPDAHLGTIEACHRRLATRNPASLSFSTNGIVTSKSSGADDVLTFRYIPKMRLRIAGRGADGLALARMAVASGIETSLQLRDGEDADEALRLGFTNVTSLSTPDSLPPLKDDPWTAFLLAFHDTDWEGALLAQALTGPAFYVGAVGSRKTHARRCERLRANGIQETQIERIRGPVGLVASMRDASMLAVSVLAEVVQAFHTRIRQRFSTTALVLLAAGRSSRFEQGDKLLATFADRPLIAHSAGLLGGEDVAARIAVVAPGQTKRADVLRTAGWSVVVNDEASTGLASSLAAGVREAARVPTADAALILLADMPDVPDQHLLHLREALTPDRSAAMSELARTLLPPAIFGRSVFERLTALTGDAGARQVFDALDNTATVSLPPNSGGDVDTREDLARLAALRLTKV